MKIKIIQKTILVVLNIIFIPNIYGQFKYLEISTYFGLPINNEATFYYKYPNDYVFSKECLKQEGCKKTTPEETLISVFSSDNYNWEQSNYNYAIKSSEKKYKLKQQLNTLSNNFKLIRKIEFSVAEEKYALIKYHINENNKLIPYSSLFKKVGNYWLIEQPENSISKLYLMFNYLSEKALDAIFLNQKTGVSYFDTKLQSFYNQNILDLVACMNYTPENKMTNEEMRIIIDELVSEPTKNFEQVYKNTKLNIDNLNVTKIFISYAKELVNQKIMYYVDDSYLNSINDENLINYEGLNLSEIKPLLKFNFNYNNKIYSVLKFSNLNQQDQTKCYIMERNKWKEISQNETLTMITNAMSKINIEFIRNIFSIKENKDQSIDILKKEIKDENNVVNIIKL
jgi:hypothetical protein